MVSNDIDGSPLIILSEKEAIWVCYRLMAMPALDETGRRILHKITRDLGIIDLLDRFRRDLKLEQSNEASKANQNGIATAESSSPGSD